MKLNPVLSPSLLLAALSIRLLPAATAAQDAGRESVVVNEIEFSLASGLALHEIADESLIRWPIVADFDSYGEWVNPPPANVVVDNSGAEGGTFGAGSRVSYKEGETDTIVFYDPNVALVAQPEWALADFEGHHGVVIVTPADGGSIMHMRRYFETTSMKGWMMSKMMPMFMKKSAENLAARHGGEVL